MQFVRLTSLVLAALSNVPVKMMVPAISSLVNVPASLDTMAIIARIVSSRSLSKIGCVLDMPEIQERSRPFLLCGRHFFWHNSSLDDVFLRRRTVSTFCCTDTLFCLRRMSPWYFWLVLFVAMSMSEPWCVSPCDGWLSLSSWVQGGSLSTW